MNDFLLVMAIVAMPAVGSLTGGLLAEFLNASARTISFVTHTAAGMLLAVIGIKLMPTALRVAAPRLVVLLFLSGAVFLVVVDWLTGRFEGLNTAENGSERDGRRKGKKARLSRNR